MTKLPYCLLLTLLLLVSSEAFSQYLKRNGQKIVNDQGLEILLRGMGLGGWMLQEPYMMEMSGIAMAQWEIRAKIEALIGEANTNTFYNAWLDNHCTKKDIDSLASWGFNSVRLPMHYNLFTLPVEEEPVPNTNTWLEKGFALSDSLIKWCAANQMYVILDMHAAPGGQGKDYAICDGNPAKPSLWESEANKQKLIALWRKLAERYVNEPWVGAYDIINEPNWSFTSGGNQNGCSENGNGPLRQLMLNITNAIRQVDNKHLIIIEGNCWGNNYNGIFPVWDNNIAVSFHKYWSYNDQNSIQGSLNIRSQQNLPIWLGESGENSNPWFTDAISLVESNNIGWAWWPLKKIGSVVGPLTIVKTPAYQQLLDYWKNGGTPPGASFAFYTLMQMASNAKIDYCTYHKDVPDAMFRLIHDSTTLPFSDHHIPGNIHCTGYDMGRHGIAYKDSEIADYHVSSGTYTAWNSGYAYRNDGVDIEKSTDTDPGSNGFQVGWITNGEWMQYTLTADSAAAYNLTLRYAGSAGAKIRLHVDNTAMTEAISLPGTGGYQQWGSFTIPGLPLYKGVQKLKLEFSKGGVNAGFMQFSVAGALSTVPFRAAGAETTPKPGQVTLGLNKHVDTSSVVPAGFSAKVNGNPVTVILVKGTGNPREIMLVIDKNLIYSDKILLSYSGGSVKDTDGKPLEPFADLEVINSLPVYFLLPGKIEAENFSFNKGTQLETCTDVGGGKNVGYNDAGDYLDYRIDVPKTGLYNMEIRTAAYNVQGSLEVQQIGENNAVLHSRIVAVPVTGGWQTWKSIYADIDLEKGLSILRIKIVSPGFNLNWYKFNDKSQGMQDEMPDRIRYYPNPARDEVTLESSVPLPRSVWFRDINGSSVRQVRINDNQFICRIPVSDLPRGFYFLEYAFETRIIRQKLIIQ